VKGYAHLYFMPQTQDTPKFRFCFVKKR